MGVDDYSSGVRVGGSGCDGDVWVSDSSVVCAASGGVRGTLRVAASVGGQVGTRTGAASYDAPGVSSVTRDNAASSGSVVVSVVGGGYGTEDYSGAVRVGGTVCKSGHGWVADSAGVCVTSGGVSGTRRVGVSVGEQSGTGAGVVSYDVPGVSGSVRMNLAVTGGVETTVVGSGYGGVSYSASVRVGGSGCEASEWASGTSVVCVGSAGGVGGTRRVAVSVGSQVGSGTGFVSYDGASVSSVCGDNVGATGSVSVTIVGGQYGASDYSSGVRVDTGGIVIGGNRSNSIIVSHRCHRRIASIATRGLRISRSRKQVLRS